MKPSEYHSNRQFYNFLIYDLLDFYLEKYKHLYKGVLVDLGCGEAPYKNYFLQYVEKYVGVDWSGSYHNIKADVISDLNEKIDLPDEYADVAVSISVMEHLREPQIFLNEVYRILKKGGYLILQVPWQWWVHEAPYDYFRYTPYALEYMLTKAGFSEFVIEPMGGFFSMWFLKFNYASLRLIKGPKILRKIIGASLIPIWITTQTLAKVLDKIDKQKELESPGYFVIAKKSE